MSRPAGKTAIVTEAARGIGLAIARCFGREGATVVIAGRSRETGGGAADKLRAQSAGALFVETEVTDIASVDAAAAATLARRGRIDILVNNAGVNVFQEPLAMPDAEWRRCFAVDLDGVWDMTRAVLPAMLAQGAGALVNIASGHSSRIIPHGFPYWSPSTGCSGLRARSASNTRHGLCVNAIAPGYVETELAAAYDARFPSPEAERRRIADLHPPQRIARPEGVAMTALFLASDEATFINAACIPVDGGRSILYHD